MTDTRRPDATGPDYEYSLSIEAVADRYAAAGFPRTIRTLQRYCASGHIDAQKVATALGDKYFVAPYSVTRHLAQIAEMAQLTGAVGVPRQDAAGLSPINRATFAGATRRDGFMSGHDATNHDHLRHEWHDGARQNSDEPPPAPRLGATDGPRQGDVPDPTRPVATDPGLSPKYVEVLERENAFLRDQVNKKDQQIEALLERDRETNFLVQGLQRMLAPLLGGPRTDEQRPGEIGRDEARQ